MSSTCFTPAKTLQKNRHSISTIRLVELYKLSLSPPVPSLAGYILLLIGISDQQEQLILKKVLEKGAQCHTY